MKKIVDKRREACLQEFSERMKQPIEDLLKWYNVRLYKSGFVATRKRNLTKEECKLAHELVFVIPLMPEKSKYL